MKSIRASLLSLACCALAATVLPAWAAPAPNVVVQPAVIGPQAMHAVLQGIARAGTRLVAVGERGVVLLSDDNGEHWRQAPTPVSVTLTAVQFVDERNGWAVGHAGVVLHSRDGGEHWALQLDGVRAAELEQDAAEQAGEPTRLAAAERLVADGADKPLLALHFSDARHGLAVGAYGLAFSTDDGGAHWQSLMGRIPNSGGLHWYAVARQGQHLYLAGEQGALVRSEDGGQTFEALQSPYEGSYFAAAVMPSGRLLVGGLRGKLFASDDQGASFQPLPTAVPASFNAITLVGQRVLLLNQAGQLMQSGLGAFTPRPLPFDTSMPLTAIAEAADGSLVGVGFNGPQRLAATPARSFNQAE